MAKHKLVTLLTDFGLEGPYVGAMKGALLSACGDAEIVDISHNVPAQDLLTASLVLAQSAPWFPPRTLNVVVVDPTVGTDRPLLYAQFGGRRFLFPDNGVITFVAASMPLETIRLCVNSDYVVSSPPSNTFHGRDIFAPLAGRLLSGLDPALLGPTPQTYKLLDVPAPHESQGGIVGQVIYVDHFGNLVSNISADMIRRRWGDRADLTVICAGMHLGRIASGYAEVAQGELLTLINSMGLLEVAVNQGSAREALDTGVGKEIRVCPAETLP